jgi:hypothetical protein
MKNFILLPLIFIVLHVAGQQKNMITSNSELGSIIPDKKDGEESSEEQSGDFKLKGFNLGLGIGANFIVNQNLVIPTISPFDNTLKLDKASMTNFTLTTLFMIPLSGPKNVINRFNKGKRLRATVYQYGDLDDENTTYVVPYGPYLIFNVNYSDFSKAAEVKPFNQSINGGMGFGWRFNDLAMAAITFDAAKFKQPKQFLIDKEGSVLQDSQGNLVTSIDSDDPNLFKDITTWSISLKIVYILSTNN